jgi:outer membrane protein assembly factor BamB
MRDRRWLLAAAGLLLVPRWQAGAEDWPQWRGPNRDAVWHEAGIMQTFPADGLKMAWRAPVGRGFSSPVVAAGRVYVTDVQAVRAPARERVLCFDEATGKPLWSHTYEAGYPDWAYTPDAGGPRATPIVAGGKVYTLGCMGRLLCLDAARGEVVWEKDLEEEYEQKEFTGITASPLIEGDLLILYLCGGKPGACVVAFDRNTGKEVWRALDDSFTYSSPIVVTAGGQKQFIVWTQEAVTSLDPATGKTWWRERLVTSGDTAVSTPVVSGNRLLIGGQMMTLDAERPAASLLWPQAKAAASRRFLSNTSTALLQGEHVYSAKVSGELVCLEAATGKQVWASDKVTSPGNGCCIHLTPLTPNGDSVLLFTDQGNLIRARLSAAGYQELSRVHVIDPMHPFNGRKVIWPPPAYANRHIFVRNDSELICASLAGNPGE